MTSDSRSAASSSQRLSVPKRHTTPPRELSEAELATLLRIADCLVPESGPNPKASDAVDYSSYLQLALGARSDVFDVVIAGAEKLADVPDSEMWGALKELWASDKATFDPLSSILAGAYFMTPQIKELIGYPGQHRDPAPLEQAADEIATGILDPVLERGHFYVSAAGE
jgi:hypothetical protein